MIFSKSELITLSIIAICGFVIIKQVGTIKELNIEKQELSNKLEDLNSKINEYKTSYEETSRELVKVQSEFSIISNELEKAKDRQDTVFAKPKLVENLINNSYTKFVEGVSCDTGSLQHCSSSQAAQQSNDQ